MSAMHKGAIMIVTCLLVHQDQVQRSWRGTFMAAEGRSPNTTVNMVQVLALRWQAGAGYTRARLWWWWCVWGVQQQVKC